VLGSRQSGVLRVSPEILAESSPSGIPSSDFDDPSARRAWPMEHRTLKANTITRRHLRECDSVQWLHSLEFKREDFGFAQ
jgi:hypothetical protein